MGVPNAMGAAELLRKNLESEAGTDLLAEMVKMAGELGILPAGVEGGAHERGSLRDVLDAAPPDQP